MKGKNKNTKTFAQRAREIKNRYSRADFDETERKEMVEALRKLRDEQEMFRQATGMDQGEDTQQFAGNNVTQKLPNPAVNKINGPYVPNLFNYEVPGLVPITPQEIPTGQWRSPETSILPTAISTGVSMLGNILGGVRARRSADETVALPRVNRTTINLEPEREALRRTYNTASNIALRSSRDASNPANAYANQIGAISGITDSLGTGLSDSYMREANTNAQYAAQADSTNAELGAQEAMINANNRRQGRAEAGQYWDNAFAAIPAGLADYRAQRSQDAMMSTLGKEYGLYEYIPNDETPWQKFIRQAAGPKYSVKNREYINSLG